jgi:hypothetical protein
MIEEKVSNDYFCTLEFDNIKKCKVRLNTGCLIAVDKSLVCSHKYEMYKELNDISQCECVRVSRKGQARPDVLYLTQDAFKKTLLKTKAKTLYKELVKKEKKIENS